MSWAIPSTILLVLVAAVGIVAKAKSDKRGDNQEKRLQAREQRDTEDARAAAQPQWKLKKGQLNGDHWYLVIENLGGTVTEVKVTDATDGRASIVQKPDGAIKLTFAGEEAPGDFDLSYVDSLGSLGLDEMVFDPARNEVRRC